MPCFQSFLGDENGAITIDWVTLTAGILIAGIITLYAIFNGGVGPLVDDTNTAAMALFENVDPGAAPDIN